jgi:hypothetical protein
MRSRHNGTTECEVWTECHKSQGWNRRVRPKNFIFGIEIFFFQNGRGLIHTGVQLFPLPYFGRWQWAYCDSFYQLCWIFYWQSNQHKKKYKLARWNIICQPKVQGGLGILNIDVQNKCPLSKWLFKLVNEEGLWQSILKRKYLRM